MGFPHAHQICPDNGACHHQCDGMCFRVLSCGPLSGVFPGDRWPDDILASHGLGARPLTPRRPSPLVPDMERAIPHPSTQFFMGYEDTHEDWNRKDAAAMADDVYLERMTHIWPLMGYLEADARWKTGRAAQVRLYALCGVELRSYLPRSDSEAPVPFGDHWDDGSRDTCSRCLAKWHEQTGS